MVRGVGRLALASALLYAGRRYFRNWGATKEETQMVLPGDELIDEPAVQTTEAEWIEAPPARVWPWLLQFGQDRGGLYSYNLLENLVGLRIHNTDGIHPGWQRLAPGDSVRLVPKGWMGLRDGVTMTVAQVDPERLLVLRGSPPLSSGDAVWSFHVVPCAQDRCRLLVRRRTRTASVRDQAEVELTAPITALMTRGMLRGIKNRVQAPLEHYLVDIDGDANPTS
jgi:hypothetical protein